jgi:hypothetical protein
MTYLHYQYCVSDFVIADEYKKEYFTEKIDSDYQVPFSNIKHSTNANLKSLEGTPRRIFVPKDEIIKYINGDKAFFTYNPLSDTPEIYLELSKIVIFDERSLMKFIKKYGLPYNLEQPKPGSGLFESELFRKNDKEKFLLGMDVLRFYEKLIKLKNVFKIWHAIQENDLKQLNEYREEFRFYAEYYETYSAAYIDELSIDDFAEVVFNDAGFLYKGGEIRHVLDEFKKDKNKIFHLKDKASEIQETWKQVKNSSKPKTIASAYLQLKLKDIDSGITATRFMNGKIIPAISFSNLMEVGGYQLKQAIFKNKKLEQCLNCGALFEKSHGLRKFCPPVMGNKRSTCENTYNQRLKRLRKKSESEEN